MKTRALPFALVTLSAAPSWACAVCGVGQSDNEWAYLAMTGVLSLVPLALMGGIAFWLYQRSKAADAAAARRSVG